MDVLYQRALRMVVSTVTKISHNSIHLANSRMGRQTYKEVGRVEGEGGGIDKYIINIIYIYAAIILAGTLGVPERTSRARQLPLTTEGQR